MKKLTTLSCIIIALTMACSNEKKSSGSDSSTLDTNMLSADSIAKPVDSAAMMKAWEDYMKPGESHAMLAKSVGKWNVELAFYHTPGGAPTKSNAIAEYKMILGGRYQQCNYKGTVEGMPFEGMNTVAFDNSRKVFISTWIDNMGTGLMYLEGTYDTANNTINLKGKSTDVISGKEITMRETHTFIDNNTQQMEMFDNKNGKEVKTMTIKLTRTNKT
jgi:hypothetical protein